MSYKIQINEQQRAIIQKALDLYHEAFVANKEISVDDYVESIDLHLSFVNLPAAEQSMQDAYGHAPGTTLHGFCI